MNFGRFVSASADFSFPVLQAILLRLVSIPMSGILNIHSERN